MIILGLGDQETNKLVFLLVCVCGCMCAWKTEDDLNFPGAEVTSYPDTRYGCWKTNKSFAIAARPLSLRSISVVPTQKF